MERPPESLSNVPPIIRNPRGAELNAAVASVLVIMTIIVFMRLWGRYRYKTPGGSRTPSYGESRFWVLLSDLTILVSYSLAVTLSAVTFVATHWGEGLHTKQLSRTQIHTTLEMFFIYQVLYKFVSGISKVATLFLLLAISTPHMKRFNLFCKVFAGYILAYCFATSLVTIFQCGTSVRSNWDKTLPQDQCFYLPPFWYSHAAINISATAVMVVLPWWLFASITYKRKHVVAAIMSALAVGETALGIVRLYGLYTSAHSKGDLTYGTVTGIMVSQLEIDFACIAACVPTVLKMSEEAFTKFCAGILGITSMAWSESRSRSSGRGGGSGPSSDSANGAGRRVELAQVRSGATAKQPSYSVTDKESGYGSNGSMEHIVRKGSSPQNRAVVNIYADYISGDDSPDRTLNHSGDEEGGLKCKETV